MAKQLTKTKKTVKTPNKEQSKKQVKVEEKNEKPKSIATLLFKAALGAALVIAVVCFTDAKGYFNPDYTNDHTRRKWNSFYKFTQTNPVDVVLVGNSHLYTGINPENLSTALGANSFILASPGTTMTDIYYCLKEAIAVNKPKIAVVETFGINDYSSHNLQSGALSDQFKSFSARKKIGQKLLSTPVLFNSRNYLAAWSNTVRNHNFIFSDTEQIKKNIELNITGEKEQPGLYLGRYVRFTSGLENAMLEKYDNGVIGFDGDAFVVGDEAKEFVDKTVKLCEENNVKLVFLTLPMYYRHFKNPEAYVAKIAEALEPHRQLWENQQIPYDYKAFTPDCFENTVSQNQHMTYYGSLVSTYKLVDFINQNLNTTLQSRSSDLAWKQLFYGGDGYFQNYSPEKDGVSQIIAKDEVIGGLAVKEIIFVPIQGAKQIFVKINRSSDVDFPLGKTIRLLLEFDINGQRQIASIDANSSYAYDTPGHYLFASSTINPAIKIISLKSISIEN